MKRSEIEVGGIYGNGENGMREVLGFPKSGRYLYGPECLSTDNVRYKVLFGLNKGQIRVMTARSFATWAKSREN